MSRSATVLTLIGFVVVLGVGALLVTGGIGRIVPRIPPPNASSSSSPSPVVAPVCGYRQLQILGAYNDCASAVQDAASGCRVSGRVLDAYITLDGIKRDYLLYVEVDGSYVGPGDYSLPPWPHSLGANDGAAKVALRDYQTGALWQSTFGVLTVSGKDGRSGLVTAGLDFTGGASNPPAQGIKLSGAWSCG
jgi:hypothetical protein